MKIIVVGGNAAGPAAAAKAKRINPEANIKLFEAGQFISTGTCEIPFLFSGQIDDYKKLIFFNEKSFFEKKGVNVYLNHLVTEVDSRNKTIHVLDLLTNDKSEYSYDKLILTTGAKSKKLPFISVEYQNLFYLKSMNDYLKIKSFMDKHSVMNVGIIGSGYIGLEIADSFSKLGLKVNIIEKANLPMPTAEPEISELLLKSMNSDGVSFYPNSDSFNFSSQNGIISGIKLGKQNIDVDLVVAAIGVVPSAELGIYAGLEIGKFGGITVDNKMKTSNSNIYAAGDNIEINNFLTKKRDYFPLATLAHEFGHIAGANSAGAHEIAQPVISNFAVKLFNSGYASVGLNLKEARNHFYNVGSITEHTPNLVHVMPDSRKVLGKIIYKKDDNSILGASFLGGAEVTGYADFISLCIRNNIKLNNLAQVNYNYTPPLSPFVNLLSKISRKI